MVKNSFPDLPTSEKLLAEELGQKVEEICTLKRDIDVPQLQVHAKRRRPTFLQDQCIAVSGRLAKVQKDILGEQAASALNGFDLIDDQLFAPFCRVRLCGLQDMPHMNGLEGTVVPRGPQTRKGCLKVRLDEEDAEREINVLPPNVEVVLGAEGGAVWRRRVATLGTTTRTLLQRMWRAAGISAFHGSGCESSWRPL